MAEEARRRSWLDRPRQDGRLLEVLYQLVLITITTTVFMVPWAVNLPKIGCCVTFILVSSYQQGHWFVIFSDVIFLLLSTQQRSTRSWLTNHTFVERVEIQLTEIYLEIAYWNGICVCMLVCHLYGCLHHFWCLLGDLQVFTLTLITRLLSLLS